MHSGAESLGKSSYNLSLIEKPDKDLVPIVETTTMELKDIGEVIAGWKLGPVTTCAPCNSYERTDTTKSPMEVPCCYEIRCFTPPGVWEARNKKVWDGVWRDPRDVVISSLVYLGDWISALLPQFSNVCIRFVKRFANQVAHRLAKDGLLPHATSSKNAPKAKTSVYVVPLPVLMCSGASLPIILYPNFGWFSTHKTQIPKRITFAVIIARGFGHQRCEPIDVDPHMVIIYIVEFDTLESIELNRHDVIGIVTIVGIIKQAEIYARPCTGNAPRRRDGKRDAMAIQHGTLGHNSEHKVGGERENRVIGGSLEIYWEGIEGVAL
nr:uncharacterized protein LOC109157957 [Ipomoea batatas]